jgi:hypothetical protein
MAEQATPGATKEGWPGRESHLPPGRGQHRPEPVPTNGRYRNQARLLPLVIGPPALGAAYPLLLFGSRSTRKAIVLPGWSGNGRWTIAARLSNGRA